MPGNLCNPASAYWSWDVGILRMVPESEGKVTLTKCPPVVREGGDTGVNGHTYWFLFQGTVLL